MPEHHYGRRHGVHLQGKIMFQMMFLIFLLGCLVRTNTQGKGVIIRLTMTTKVGKKIFPNPYTLYG